MLVMTTVMTMSMMTMLLAMKSRSLKWQHNKSYVTPTIEVPNVTKV